MENGNDTRPYDLQKSPGQDDFVNQLRPHKERRHSINIFRRTWQEWASGTSCHGIKFVFDGGSSIIRRAFWFLVFGGLVYYLVSTSVTQTLRFLEYKTATKTTMTIEKNMTFPAVTICNFNLIKNDSVTDPKTRGLLKELYMKAPNITFIQELGDDFLSNVSLRQLFTNGTPTVEETFLLCQWLTDFHHCRELLTPKETDIGYCYTFASKDSNRTYTIQTDGVAESVSLTMWLNQDNYFIGDTSSAGMKIIIHDPHEEPNFNNALSFSPGHSYFVSLRKEQKTFLSHPVKAFGSKECTDTKAPDFRNPLEYSDHYSYFACMTECKFKYIRTICGCSSIYDVEGMRECTALDHIFCTHEATRNFSTTYDTDYCNCPIPCSLTVYKATVSSAYFPNYNFMKILYGNNSEHHHHSVGFSRENLVQVRVYFETLMTKHEDQILEFTQEDLIASFGGFLGLAIGASAITILEFFEMFVVCLCRLFANSDKMSEQEK